MKVDSITNNKNTSNLLLLKINNVVLLAVLIIIIKFLFVDGGSFVYHHSPNFSSRYYNQKQQYNDRFNNNNQYSNNNNNNNVLVVTTTTIFPNYLSKSASGSILLNNEEDEEEESNNSNKDNNDDNNNDNNMANKLKYDAERYHNRCILLENTLKQKLNHLQLNDKKLLVLQDAAKRLVKKQEQVHANNLLELEQKQDEMVLQLNERSQNEKDNNVKNIQEWKNKYHNINKDNEILLQKLELLENELKEIKETSDEKINTISNKYNKLKQTYKLDQDTWRSETIKHVNALHDLNKYKKLYNDIIKQKQKLDKIEGKRNNNNNMQLDDTEISKNLKIELESIQQSLEKEKQRNKQIKSKYNEIVQEKNSIQNNFNNLLQQQQQQWEMQAEKESTAKEQEEKEKANADAATEWTIQELKKHYEDAIIIAQSASDAAERREKILQIQNNKLQQTNQNIIQEKLALEQYIATLQSQIYIQSKKEKEIDQAIAIKNKDTTETTIKSKQQQIYNTVQATSTNGTLKEVQETNNIHNELNKAKASSDDVGSSNNNNNNNNKTSSIIRDKLKRLLRPGIVGNIIQEQHLTFEKSNNNNDNKKSTSKIRRLLKSILPRIPYRFGRKS